MTLNNAQLLEPALPPVLEQQAPPAAQALPDFDRDVWCILGLPFDRVSLRQAGDIMLGAAAQKRRCFLSTPNLNFAVACMDDAAFRNSVIQSDLSIADGMPLIWIARAIGLPIKERVAGSSLFQWLRETKVETGQAPMRVYFFGGPPGVAEAAAEKLNAVPSGMRSMGFNSPGFGSIEDMSDAETIGRINDSNADFLVVALGAKKGQAWIQHNLKHLRAPLVSHLGAVVNFVAGTVSRAPLWAQKTGLEWLWRIKEEPKLWRRYWDDGVALLNLMAWRVLPCVWDARRRQPAAAEFEQAGMVCRRDRGGDCELLLSGALGTANIARWRAVLKDAAQTSEPLVVDCAKVSHIDSAALASLMLLYGDCVARRRPWAIINPDDNLRRQFHLHCAQYLLQPLA
ncbi:MAG: N-acetylglucosaminyldiphosphoundecaprenol N-acetyl-beta-D-mannosaminyltransferase [Herbaspirillum frisingense]|uniref:N-acetylglucosaminyldiphosphoundecaprenol N-acetyl-beta-D-mannosaminyltransferase n=1 Tax=Herbaspirillum frisingense TaxID=92645 RepID=A0A7V8FW93_9BURK|nr:MAG: N-acetylglucosaminyldiphosphoundecaprenol N-acetyl-beta-D-mannosaminyltransferase [Herbaspirillum frisingense]